MNIKRTGMFGLTALFLCLASPFIASPASAQTYTCATVPTVVLGDVNIDEPGTCTIGHSVTADGNIIIKAVGNISVQTLNAGYSVWLESSDGSITTNNAAINTNSVGNGGNLLLIADGNISTGDLDTHSRGGIEIVANKGGGSTLFSIGSPSVNGVNGSLKSITTTYGGADPTDHIGGIFVTNGDSASTGGITVATAANIQIRTNASASRTGLLILNAQNGPLTLPTGSLSADGGTNQMAGSIYLMAKTINTVNGTVISASQSLSATGTNRCVCISAETINIAGANGLQLLSDGNSSQADAGQLSLLPKGSITVASTGDYQIMNWVSNGSQQFITHAPMTVTGNAPLFASANGNNTRVQVSGYPMTFSNGAVTIQSRGATSHKVIMGYNGALNGTTQLAFTGTGNVNIDANGLSGAGGEVTIYGDKMTFNAPIFNISANGPSAGNGAGGQVYVGSSALTLNAASKVTVTANAASVGSGNAILGEIGTNAPKAIQFFPGAVPLNVGTAAGQYSFQAKGGKTGGNGGTIYMGASSLTLKTAAAIDASALPTTAGGSGNGDGGEIYLNNYITVDPAATVSAIGKGTGKGGKLSAFHNIINIDILKYVKVDGGATVPTTQLNGSIRLNGIWCRQWKLSGGQSWPKTHWVCTDQSDNPSTPAALSINTAAADVATSSAFNGLRALLNDSTHKVNIFVFSGSANFNTFWSEVLLAKSGGLTFKIPATSTNIYLNPWQSGSIGADAVVDPYSYNRAKEVAAHELGHAVDIAFKGTGVTLPSNDTNWGSNKTRDMIDLNTVLDPVTFTQFHRYPCKVTPLDGGRVSGTPPLAGVTDIRNNVPVCLGTGEVNNAMLTGGATWTQSSVTATDVLSLIEQGLFQTPPELHAQTFAWSAVGSQTARPMFDQVMDNGFFPCIKAWANAEKTGSLPTTSSCSAPLTH